MGLLYNSGRHAYRLALDPHLAAHWSLTDLRVPRRQLLYRILQWYRSPYWMELATFLPLHFWSPHWLRCGWSCC